MDRNNAGTAHLPTHIKDSLRNEAVRRGYNTALENHADLYSERQMPGHREYIEAHREIERLDRFFRPISTAAKTEAARLKIWHKWQTALAPHQFTVMA